MSSVQELTIEELYQKKEQRDHALELPDTYIGSIETHKEPMWVLQDGQMIQREIQYVPGLFKIYDEILVNAIDHWTRMTENRDKQFLIQTGKMVETPEITLKMKFKPVKNIKVNINQEAGSISVYNDGNGIPVVVHQVVGVYLPEMLFSQFLTSGNYKSENVNQTKIIGGKNGYGATLTALFSKEFIIETVDAERGKKYVQTYRNNLSIIEPPVIEDVPKTTLPYTIVTFKPDFERFGLPDGLTDDIMALFEKRVYDSSAWCKGVNVFYNDIKIDIRDFNQYTNLYLGKDRTEAKRVFIEVNDRWSVCATVSPDHEFQQVSMVNGILTSKGGRHVDHVADQIAKKLAEKLTKGKTVVDKKVVKANLWLFVRAVIENPGFDSQTKECLNTQVSKFGSKCILSDEDIEKIGKCGINQRAKDLSSFKEKQMSTNTDGKKTNKLLGMDKLVDAEYAGGKNAHKCTLVLTEGDSAVGFAKEGFKSLTVEQRKFWGAFPLRGKVLNVRDAKMSIVDKNAEITHIKKILGLRVGVDYSGNNIQQLRYGRVMLLTDQDLDGDHIKGLLINLFHHFWPSLLKRNDFIVTMVTPIVKAWKERTRGLSTERLDEIKFYSENEYLDWKKSNNNGSGWEVRYYKGLGTSKPDEAFEVFEEMKVIKYMYEEDAEDAESQFISKKMTSCDRSINLAFLQKNADMRKEWLLAADLDKTTDYNINQETYSDFINHRLVHFSWEDTHRSIPNICDGLKPSQRKIMYYMLRWGPKKSEKVAQLAGGISKKAAYHHGETSLMDTMIGLAQNYPGTNNINLLTAEGNFGSKLAKGKDSASPRYIYTKNETITPYLFKKDDVGLFDYQNDDGFPVEPRWYLPIIPMVLVNGTTGIGTGFSTFIPQYNPIEIIERLQLMLNRKSVPEEDLIPWYRGFEGRIIPTEGGFYCIGKYEITGSTTLKIFDLPINGQKCFNDYKTHLEQLLQGSTEDKKPHILTTILSDVTTDSSFGHVSLSFKTRGLSELLGLGTEKMEKELMLRSKLTTTNMTLFDADEHIKKYETAQAIIDDYFVIRLKFYEKRLAAQIQNLDFQLQRAIAKLRFVTEIIEDKITIFKKKKSEIILILEQAKYPKFPNKILAVGELANVDENESNDSEENENSIVGATYEYLLKMRIDSFSVELMEKLAKERDDHMAAIEKLQQITPTELWLTDLVDLKKAYLEWLGNWYKTSKIEIPKKINLSGIKLV